MFFIENNKFKIEIEIDQTFTINSADNKLYDVVLNPLNLSSTDYYKVLSVTVNDGIKSKNVALIGFVFGAEQDVAILENDNLIVLLNTHIVVLDCSTLAVKRQKKLDLEFATSFSIHEYLDGYIIYGEINIVKLSSEFEIDWEFSGADIFVTLDGSMPFYIENEIICLSDWQGNKYRLNKFGKIV